MFVTSAKIFFVTFLCISHVTFGYLRAYTNETSTIIGAIDATTCICTTVPCPVSGANKATEGYFILNCSQNIFKLV
jgi:hypothetical protein